MHPTQTGFWIPYQELECFSERWLVKIGHLKCLRSSRPSELQRDRFEMSHITEPLEKAPTTPKTPPRNAPPPTTSPLSRMLNCLLITFGEDSLIQMSRPITCEWSKGDPGSYLAAINTIWRIMHIWMDHKMAERRFSQICSHYSGLGGLGGRVGGWGDLACRNQLCI